MAKIAQNTGDEPRPIRGDLGAWGRAMCPSSRVGYGHREPRSESEAVSTGAGIFDARRLR
jgi:hypothetical protein